MSILWATLSFVVHSLFLIIPSLYYYIGNFEEDRWCDSRNLQNIILSLPSSSCPGVTMAILLLILTPDSPSIITASNYVDDIQ